MKILVACEESQAVTIELRKLGHEAYSCDILPSSGGKPQWHIQSDVLKQINGMKQTWFENGDGKFIGLWDMMIAFPPCTHLAVSGARHFEEKRKDGRQQEAIDFFLALANAPIKKIAIENPIGIMSTIYKKPDQVIQPFEFGHPESKATCLWLKNLPLLKSTKYADWKLYRCKCGNVFDADLGKYGCCDGPAKILWDNQTKSGQNKLPPSKDRHILRAKTYPGIAKAMAEQWTSNL